MKQTRLSLFIVSILLLCAMAVNLTGCSTAVQANDLMKDIIANPPADTDMGTSESTAITDFGVRLFQAGAETGKNTLISPLSVLCALAMTTNGADGETLAQMEAVLGMTTDEMNEYLYSYMHSLPQGEGHKLSLANSIWFTDAAHFSVRQDFLQCNADYYGADIYRTPFDDGTVRDINNWVKEKTDGMIPEILNNIPPYAVMYLINALAFDAEWADIYTESQIRSGTFTLEDGTTRDVEFMYNQEGRYLEDDSATGFIKYYKGSKYAFVALLPKEGVSVADYVATLNGAGLSALLAAPQYTDVNTAIPKFETEYSTEMSAVLQQMGMIDAFIDTTADLTRLGSSTEGNLYISRVLHKTFISVDERGTKAGAVTAAEVTVDSAGPISEPKTVYLDRPFVYLLIDCETNIPFFIGTMMDVEA